MILFLTDLDILQNRPVTSQATSLWGSPWMCPRTKASHNKVHHKGSGRWKYWAKCKEGLSRECARERAGYPQGDWESNHTGYILACVDVIYTYWNLIPDSQVTRTAGGKQKRCLLIYAQNFSNNIREQLLQGTVVILPKKWAPWPYNIQLLAKYCSS